MFGEWFSRFAHIPRLAVVGVSDWITNEARNSLLSVAMVIRRIYDWVDLDIFRPVDATTLRKELDVVGRFIILGVASTWSNAKGLNTLIELSSIVPDEMVFVLVGNLHMNVELPKNVIHVKEIHDVKELAEYYSMADVFLNLSREETFGKVTAEALACGTPVVVFDSTANPELVGQGCGYIAKSENVADILKYIREIEQTSKLHYTDNCVQYAEENFSKDDRIRDYETIYKLLLQSDVS